MSRGSCRFGILHAGILSFLLVDLGSCSSPRPPAEFADAPSVASADSVRIRYEARGLGRPPLVFVHGWCCDRSTWRNQVEHFSADHLVVALDLAGHGESGHGRRRWSMEAFGRDVIAVVEKLGLERAVLVGHSMGGTVILEAARQAPERAVALVPVDTFFDVELRLSKEQAQQFLSPFRADFRATVRGFVRDNMFTPRTDPALVEEIVSHMSQQAPEVALGALEELVTFDHASALRESRVPVRCINSDKYPTRVDVARKYASSFDVALVSGVGHFVMMEEPEEFNWLLSKVLVELASDRGRSGAREAPGPAGLRPPA